MRQKVLIVGGGFGGIHCAKGLKRADVDVLLIDCTNHHLFQPLLYQVATAALSPGNIAMPIREIVASQENTTVIMGVVTSIDKEQKTVTLHTKEVYPYDILVLAPGSCHHYFEHPEWEKHAPGLKTVDDALKIREKILLAFERAERLLDPEKRAKYLRFVIVGGGPTGVEMAGSIAEIARKTLFNNFRRIHPESAEIYLVEGQPQILSTYPKELSFRAQKDLYKMGVKVFCGKHVTAVDERGVYIGDLFIESANVIWATGNIAPSFLQSLEVERDHAGRIFVEQDLAVPNYQDLFVIGDAAFCKQDKEPLPALAAVAIQQGQYVAQVIRDKIPKEKRGSFRYFDKGMIATIGKAKAVAVLHKIQLTGFSAWMVWGAVHIAYLVSFRNRALVLMQWVMMYIFGFRQARLIKSSYDSYAEDLEERVNG